MLLILDPIAGAFKSSAFFGESLSFLDSLAIVGFRCQLWRSNHGILVRNMFKAQMVSAKMGDPIFHHFYPFLMHFFQYIHGISWSMATDDWLPSAKLPIASKIPSKAR